MERKKSNTPKIGNRRIQLIRVGKSIWLKWVNVLLKPRIVKKEGILKYNFMYFSFILYVSIQESLKKTVPTIPICNTVMAIDICWNLDVFGLNFFTTTGLSIDIDKVKVGVGMHEFSHFFSRVMALD